MEDEALFSVMSKCFAPVDEDEWKHLTSRTLWSDFLDAARNVLQDGHELGVQMRPIAWRHASCPLQDFLSVGEVDALFRPPTFEEKRSFAARHFTGGLPTSALPIESLYVRRSAESVAPSAVRQAGSYMGDSALYMRDAVARMGLTLPPEFSACPDHLALELDLVAVMLRSGMQHQARTFLAERFAWLTSYRIKLLELEEDASFYVGLVDVLVGIWSRHAAFLEESA